MEVPVVALPWAKCLARRLKIPALPPATPGVLSELRTRRRFLILEGGLLSLRRRSGVLSE